MKGGGSNAVQCFHIRIRIRIHIHIHIITRNVVSGSGSGSGSAHTRPDAGVKIGSDLVPVTQPSATKPPFIHSFWRAVSAMEWPSGEGREAAEKCGNKSAAIYDVYTTLTYYYIYLYIATMLVGLCTTGENLPESRDTK